MTKVISIHSFRGGTGKSSLVANLAALLALQGHHVGIVDTDIQSPGVHVLFGMTEESMQWTLNNYFWGDCAIEDAAYTVTPQVVMQSRGEIYLVPSSIKANEIARILSEGYDVELLIDGIRQLSEALGLDYLIVDTHPGLNTETLLAIALSDTVLLTLRPDNQDFQGTAVTLKVAQKLDIPNLALVVNYVLPEYNFEEMQQQIEQTFKTPVVGIFPLSSDVLRLRSQGVFALKYPNHPLTQQVQKVLQYIS